MSLHYHWIDIVWIFFSGVVVVGSILLPMLGYGEFWVPPFLLK
jgi:hypothetical protein